MYPCTGLSFFQCTSLVFVCNIFRSQRELPIQNMFIANTFTFTMAIEESDGNSFELHILCSWKTEKMQML